MKRKLLALVLVVMLFVGLNGVVFAADYRWDSTVGESETLMPGPTSPPSELSPESGAVKVTGGDQTVTVTNKIAPSFELTVEKKWVDAAGNPVAGPDGWSVTVYVKQVNGSGVEVYKPITLTEADDSATVIVPSTDATGAAYTYSVYEDLDTLTDGPTEIEGTAFYSIVPSAPAAGGGGGGGD